MSTDTLTDTIERAITPSRPATDHPAAFYIGILESLSTATLLLNEHLDILYLNPAAKNLFVASDYRINKQNIAPLFAHDPQALEDLKNGLHSGHPYTRRAFQLKLPKKHQITIDYTVTPIFFHADGPSLLLEIVQLDTLLRMSREESLLSTHTVTRTLIRGVAHEVKNPLGGIRGAAQLLERELKHVSPDPDHQETATDCLTVIINETDRLRNLVDRMLGPTKRPQITQCNIHRILEHVIQIVSAENKITLSIKRDYDVSLPDFSGDRDQLIQAFLNIMGNAVQALEECPPDEPACITLTSRILRQLTINGKRHKLAICVRIHDNGPGIPERLLEAIFLPMVSGRAQGTGLGLSMAQEIMNQHHGLIECESQPGNTEFFIFIPI